MKLFGRKDKEKDDLEDNNVNNILDNLTNKDDLKDDDMNNDYSEDKYEDEDQLYDDEITSHDDEVETDEIDNQSDLSDELSQETDDDSHISDSEYEQTDSPSKIMIVGTQIFTSEIDTELEGYNFTTPYGYRIGYESNNGSTMYTVTKKKYKAPLSSSTTHASADISWYNDLTALGYSYAVVSGRSVLGVIICEPQYWNNTLIIRHLQIAKDYRSQGLGSELVEKCALHAADTGFRALSVELQSSNGIAIDFFAKNYFHMVGMNIELYSNTDLKKGDVGVYMNRNIRNA